MKNNIIMFLLGIFVTISVAFTSPVQNLITTKPSKPAYTIVQSFNDYRGVEVDIKNFISSNIKNGYIVKTVSITGTREGYTIGVVVMEKY